MATVSSREIVDQIIAGDGIYGDDEDGYDPPVILIVEYNNQFNGDLAWGLVYETDGDPQRYHRSPACHNARTIWERGVGMVNHG